MGWSTVSKAAEKSRRASAAISPASRAVRMSDNNLAMTYLDSRNYTRQSINITSYRSNHSTEMKAVVVSVADMYGPIKLIVLLKQLCTSNRAVSIGVIKYGWIGFFINCTKKLLNVYWICRNLITFNLGWSAFGVVNAAKVLVYKTAKYISNFLLFRSFRCKLIRMTCFHLISRTSISLFVLLLPLMVNKDVCFSYSHYYIVPYVPQVCFWLLFVMNGVVHNK